MSLGVVILFVFLLAGIAGFVFGQKKLCATSRRTVVKSRSLPSYYGTYVAFWAVVPAVLIALVGLGAQDAVLSSWVLAQLPADYITSLGDSVAFFMGQVKNAALAGGDAPLSLPAPIVGLYASAHQTYGILLFLIVAAISSAGIAYGLYVITPMFNAKERLERYCRIGFFISSLASVLITVVIVLSVLIEALRFFEMIHIVDFLFGLQWSPQMAIRADQAGGSGAFGAVPLFTGTLLITVVAMVVAIPVGLMSAIFMAEYATPRVRTIAKPVLEILAGIPTVVYGYFAALTIAPLLRAAGQALGLDVASESALAAGVVMGIMIVPFISSLSDDVITAVPRSLRDASLAMGATKSETITQVILPAALPGVMGAVLLAISRAIGETMIVVMAAGMAANLSFNPLESVTTVTAQIVALLVGDQEFNSPKTLAAFALGLTLFCVTLVLNVVALLVVKFYREKYE